MSWTVEQVLALASGAAAARAGRELASARAWLHAGYGGDALWGECQGSAKEPYRTGVDLSGPAFMCSCPSPRFPCKHALGLFLAYAAQAPHVTAGEPPAWLSTWLQSRRARADKAQSKEAADPERAALEQEKRARRREERIRGGVDDLELWLHDLVRGGLAEAASRPWTSFEQMSERLVDAQAPGLARYVRDLGGLPHRAAAWPEHMLITLGRLSLLLDASRRMASLDPDVRAEVRTLIGINEGREAVLATPPTRDTWDVVGRRLIDGDRFTIQRTWLWGQHTRRWALVLDFSAAGQPLDRTLAPGTRITAELCFYSGSARLRALVKEPPVLAGAVGQLPGQSIDAVLRDYAEWLGRNPWQERIPAALNSVVPHQARGESWCAVDADGRRLPLAGFSQTGWQLLAIAGGHPIDVFGEWDGFSFWPLSVLAAGRFAPLRALVAA